MRRYLELEPRDIAGRLPCDIGDRLADERAAVDVLPARPGKMAADAFAIEQQGRDRLAEGPCQLALGAGLAFIDLCAFGIERDDRVLAMRCNRRRNLRRCGARK